MFGAAFAVWTWVVLRTSWLVALDRHQLNPHLQASSTAAQYWAAFAIITQPGIVAVTETPAEAVIGLGSALGVEVIAKQWAWDFNYVKEDVYSPGIQGQLSEEGPKGSLVQEELPTLYLPVGANVEIELESRDVIHSFWVVDFLYKKDMYPGKTNYMSFVPEREGTYAGKCAELCGEYHSLMLFNVEVVSQAEYDDYIESLRDAGQEGQLSNEYDRNQNLPGTGAPELKEEH